MREILEALAGVSIFAVPCLVVAAVDQHKLEKERKVREIARILEEEEQKNFRRGIAYEKECSKQRVLHAARQQVDKEQERYARMVG